MDMEVVSAVLKITNNGNYSCEQYCKHTWIQKHLLKQIGKNGKYEQ
jgi:hypothetical protein